MGKRGRKPMYDSVEEMQEKIDAYFRDCDGKLLTDEAGKPVFVNGVPVIVGKHPPTMTGLALALGFATRQSICNYRKKAAFEKALTIARSRVEMYTEERLFDRQGCLGAKFSLILNFGWGAEDRKGREDQGGIVRIIERAPGQRE